MSLHLAVLFCWWIVKLLGNGVVGLRVVSSHNLEIEDETPMAQGTMGCPHIKIYGTSLKIVFKEPT